MLAKLMDNRVSTTTTGKADSQFMIDRFKLN